MFFIAFHADTILVCLLIAANLGLASVQPNNEAVINNVVDPRKTQQNFVNFFESIGKNDTEQRETYRTILEEETRQEQQAFNSMKDEFRSARLRNDNKWSQFSDENGDTDEAGAVHKREVDAEYSEYPEEPEGITSSNVDEPTTEEDTPVSALNLRDIEYGGTWQSFCDATQMDTDFTSNPVHDLKQIRKMICLLRQDSSNRTNERKSLLMFGTYKYCLSMKWHFDGFFDSLLRKLSLMDFGKKTILLSAQGPPIDETTVCFNSTAERFFKMCVGKQNPCTRMFRFLLARACDQPWLKTDDILTHIDQVCAGRWISDEIDWDAIFKSVNVNVNSD